MRNTIGLLLAVAVVFSIPLPCRAQTTTDVSQTVASLLSSVGPVPWTHTVTIQQTCLERHGNHSVGIPCWHNETRTENLVLVASNIKISKSDPVTFDALIRNDFPQQLVQSSIAWANCSLTESATFSEQLSVSFQRSTSIQISNTVAHAQSAQLNLTWKISDALSIGGNVQVTDTITKATVDTTSYQNTVQRTHGISTVLAPQKTFGATISTWPVSYKSTFHTVATVDADLGPNDKGYHHLSDLVAEAKRTFTISGVIGLVDAADGETISYDFPYDFKKCPNGSKLIQLPGKQVGGLKGTNVRSLK